MDPFVVQEVEPPLSVVLKSITRVQHDQIERNPQFARLLAPDLSLDEYRAILSRLYGFHLPLERLLAPLLKGSEMRVDFSLRRKSPLLRRDLRALGMPAAAVRALPSCDRLPEPTTSTAALGCLYVVEGASLGGQIIARHLKRTLRLDADGGAAFFHSHGARVGVMWRHLKQEIDQHGRGADERAVILQAARDTFATLDAWM